MKKNSQIIIKCTTETKNKLQAKADMLGLRLNSYCNLVLNSVEPKITLQGVNFPK